MIHYKIVNNFSPVLTVRTESIIDTTNISSIMIKVNSIFLLIGLPEQGLCPGHNKS